MVKVGDIWFEYDDVKIIIFDFNHFCNSNIVYVILQKEDMMETFKGHWACPKGCLLKTSFHALLTFIYFDYLLYSLAFVSCCF